MGTPENGMIVRLISAVAAVVALAQPALSLPLAPHRAIYDLALDPEKVGTQVDRAQGRIAFQLTGNACEGYTITLRQVTALDTGEGQETVSDLRSESWENASANAYRFKTQNFINEILREDVSGRANKRKNGSFTVRVTKPKSATFALKGPVLFPTQHTQALIAAAERGERLLAARVFDGSPDGRKIYETLTVIGEAEPAANPPKIETLKSLKRYPVTISYFDPGKGDRTPSYTLAFDLFENGISGALRLDYGNFALKGQLSSVELLPQKPCKSAPVKR